MRFVRFDLGAGPEVGMENSMGRLVPCSEICRILGWDPVESLQEIIDNWNDFRIGDAMIQAEKHPGFDPAGATILTPIPWTKRNVFCLGKNYLEHAKELEGLTANLSGVPEYPIYFTKTASPAIGPEEAIRIFPEVTGGEVDYEVELAIVIGKQGVNINPLDAEEYIFGYTILNDISARQLQVRHTQWFRGKCLDTHTVIGPAIVHRSLLPFPLNLKLGTRVNGEVRQESDTSHLIFDIPTIISDISRATTLYPGDIIATGTPSGVGMGFKPPRYLQAGDVVECWIEGIGVLKNPVTL